MAFCPTCGKEVNDAAVVCVHCGCSVNSKASNQVVTADSSSFGWGLLGFCIPLVGLILWLVWKNDTPLKARSAGMGALISTIVSVVFYIIYFIVIVGILGASGSF